MRKLYACIGFVQFKEKLQEDEILVADLVIDGFRKPVKILDVLTFQELIENGGRDIGKRLFGIYAFNPLRDSWDDFETDYNYGSSVVRPVENLAISRIMKYTRNIEYAVLKYGYTQKEAEIFVKDWIC